MGIAKILERLWGSPELVSPEHSPEPLSFEQAQECFERALADYEAALSAKWEVQRKDEAAGLGITEGFIAAAQHGDHLRYRLMLAKADFIQAGGSPDTLELTEPVTRKVQQWFPADEQAEAIRLLETECARNLPFCETSDAEDLESVRLAVLKLAGGKLTELRRQIEEAKLDWRDVRIGAEGPEAVERGVWSGAELDEQTRNEISARDRQQYEEWLRGDGPLRGAILESTNGDN